MDLGSQIKAKAYNLGLDIIGIAPAGPIDPEDLQRLDHWVKAGYGAQLPFVLRTFQTRLEPTRLLPGARSVITVGIGFKPPHLPDPPPRPAGRVAMYALYKDYHLVLKAALQQLADALAQATSTRFRFKIAVDSSPVLERALAVRGGLGFICTNHMLANPMLGPTVFLGELITDLELTPDEPVEARCQQCGACVKACPTGGLVMDGPLDATRCINTWTIEWPGQIPDHIASAMGDRVYGCDACITACPLYLKAPAFLSPLLRFYPERRWLDLEKILAMDQDMFRRCCADSPILRLGLDRLKRNARICLQNIEC